MANPKQAAPDTLPANFSGWDSAPDTLPANFSGFDQSKQAPAATIGPAPTGAKAYLNNLESDVRYGGEQTVFGRMLKAMGAQGTNIGAQAGAGDTLASPILGPIHTAQGAASIPEHPFIGALKTLGGALETASLPLGFMAPEAGEAAASVPSKIAGMIPSTERAGQAFQAVKQAAGKIPIDLSAPGNAALDTEKLAQSGGSMPKVVRDFLKRTTDPNQAPLTYEEARNFYSNASRLSADEMQRLTPVMRRQVGQFTKALGDSIQGAASQAGVGGQYSGAMQEYAKASKLKGLAQDSADWLSKEAMQKLPWLAAGYGAKKVYDATR